MPVDAISPSGAQFTMQESLATMSGAARTASDVVGLFSTSGRVVNGITTALNLPDPIKQIARMAAAVVSGDVAGVVSAALGMVSAAAGQAAQTTYHPGPGPAARSGYAPSCHPPPMPGPRPPDLLRQQQALEVMSRHFCDLDNAAGVWFPDGRFGGFDLNAVMRGPYPEELKDAVRYLRSHPDQLTALDARDGLDGLITARSVEDMLGRLNARIGQGPTPSCSPPPGIGTSPRTIAPPPAPTSFGPRQGTPLQAAQRAVDVARQRVRDNPDDKDAQIELQEAQHRLQELFTLLSNLSSSNHEMAMTAIRNMAR